MSASVSLEDKYTLQRGRVLVTGQQALVLLMILQRRRDLAAGLDTRGFCSGYRGSPLSTVDQEFHRARKILEPLGIRYQGGVNEALAATAVWGTQLVHTDRQAKVAGVFGMWYGKGAGLDQCIDAMRHANNAGTAPLGGVLAVVGDDHALKSSALAHHCEPTFSDLRIPVLYPSDIGDMLRLGLLGYSLSRFAGCWVGLKALPEVVNTSAIVDLGLAEAPLHVPTEAPDGSSRYIQWPDPWPAGEKRFHQLKWPRILRFIRDNNINQCAIRAQQPRLGIVTAGKSYVDVLEALAHLGLSPQDAAQRGVSIYKLGCPWPLEPIGIREFAAGHPALLVVEEKRATIEDQLKTILYDAPAEQRPRIWGRYGPDGSGLLPPSGELSPELLASAIAALLDQDGASDLRAAAARLREREQALAPLIPEVARTPFFCSGCPHNTSTKVPEGSRAMAGIGCHGMAMFAPDGRTATHTHMGGEGATWIGLAPFTATPHVFQNIGDGTYHHSGVLAIRAAVSADINITYKILFNDAVAMTGGQSIDGQLTVPQVVAQLRGEGVARIAVVADEPARLAEIGTQSGVTLHHRDELDSVQRELRAVTGVTVLVYSQMCATEKRRRRKRKLLPESDTRVYINPAVCEGCGDCSAASNCLSVTPIETEFGRKRRIDQSACNKDLSCTKGFCPSFITLKGARVRLRGAEAAQQLLIQSRSLPEPAVEWDGEGTYNILCTGIGGTGVVTVTALLAMAARICGLNASVHDRLGMAQKFGSVTSHVRLAREDCSVGTARIPMGGSDVILGCDLLVTAQLDVLRTIAPGSTHVILNADESAPAAFVGDPDFDFRSEQLTANVAAAAAPGQVEIINATRLANALTGDSIGTNMFMFGYAYQRGLVPVPLQAIEQAIELNGVSVEGTKRAFSLGRLAASDPAALRTATEPALLQHERAAPPESLEQLIARRREILTEYQNAAYAERYAHLVARVRERERQIAPGREALVAAAARYYFKVLAYKDEYEVARLHTDPRLRQQLELEFEGPYRMEFHLAPPLMARRRAGSSAPVKITFGPWVARVFQVLARLRFLRGTALDPFGYSADRKLDRQIVHEYEDLVERVLTAVSADNYELGVQLLSIPEQIRGFGHVKEAHHARASARARDLVESLQPA